MVFGTRTSNQQLQCSSTIVSPGYLTHRIYGANTAAPQNTKHQQGRSPYSHDSVHTFVFHSHGKPWKGSLFLGDKQTCRRR